MQYLVRNHVATFEIEMRKHNRGDAMLHNGINKGNHFGAMAFKQKK